MNQSLDLTMDMIGQEWVQEGVHQIWCLQWALVEEHCLSKAVFPCNTINDTFQNGYQEDCYDHDSWGCGYQCVATVLELFW
jgi:hypothetical protein